MGDVGQPTLSECPPHGLRPETLRKLLGRLEALEIVGAEAGKSSLGFVRLRVEGVQALAYKAVGTKPKASATAPPAAAAPAATSPAPLPRRPAASAPAVADRRAETSRVPEIALALRDSAREAQTTLALCGNNEKAPMSMPQRPKRSQAPAKAVSSAAPPKVAAASTAAPATASAPKAAGPRLVRRRIDLNNTTLLRRLVQRGISKGDEDWTQRWDDFCRRRRITVDVFGENPTPRDAVSEFVELSVAALLKKDWAREFMYQVEGQSDEVEGQSDDEDESDDSDASDDAEPAAIVPVEAGQKRPAAAMTGDQGADDDEYTDSSESDSEEERKRRKLMKKDKKIRKMGMLGYGDYMKNMTPEVMMMNQMMGMSMMMNNPLAMMSQMSNPMMSNMMQQKKTPETQTEPRRRVAPPPPPPPPAPVGSATVPTPPPKPPKAMIDADDL